MDAPQVPFRIGRWTVEQALHQLCADGRTVKIEPKAMAVLRYLAERPGQVVGREALLDAVWPGVIVGDDALTQVIVKLRKALGDAPDDPTYIQTIPKGGYRLVAPVGRCDAAPQPSGEPPAKTRPPANRRQAWLAVSALAVVFAAALAWHLAHEPESGKAASAPASVAQAGPSTVAVRPFEPLSDDPQELLLARGIAADLVTDLSKLPGLRVASFPAQGPTDGARMPHPAARYSVTGDVQRSGERIRLQVRLADAQAGALLWSERFDVALGGLFEMQDALASRILAQLPVKLGEAERRRTVQRYTRNLEAYETYQRGQLALQLRRREDNELARELFRRAIALDANFARAYVGLAMTHAAEYRNQWTPDRASALERALELAQTAHRIDPGIAETYWVLAFVDVHRQQHGRALGYLDDALRLNPSFADGYALKGGILTSTGHAAEGVPLLHAAMRLSPDSGHTYFMLLGRAYFALDQFEQARINLEHAVARNPEFVDARVYLAATHLAAGDRAAASWEAEEIRALKPDFTVQRWLETNPTADERLRARLARSLGELGL